MRKLLAAALLALSPVAMAFAHEAKGPNGGTIRDAGPYHLELVVRESDVSVFVTDAKDKPVEVAGATASAIVLADKKSHSIPLQTAGKNVLRGQGAFAPSKDVQVVVSVTMPGSKAVQARFAPARAN